MELETIILEEKDGIVILTLNRPEALNVINGRLMSELDYLFNGGIDFSNKVGVIITGSGTKAFAAGADIKEFTTLTVEEATEKSRFGHSVYRSIETCTVPVIAAINGFSLGGGNELAMACHIRVASLNARFGQPEVNLGLIPGYGGTQRLIQLIGKGRALELLMTADMIDASKALEYGLVTHIVEQEELISKAKEILNKIGSKGPLAVSRIIESVNAYFDENQNGFEKEIIDFGKTMLSDQCKEGVQAFVEKRKANFRN